MEINQEALAMLCKTTVQKTEEEPKAIPFPYIELYGLRQSKSISPTYTKDQHSQKLHNLAGKVRNKANMHTHKHTLSYANEHSFKNILEQPKKDFSVFNPKKFKIRKSLPSPDLKKDESTGWKYMLKLTERYAPSYLVNNKLMDIMKNSTKKINKLSHSEEKISVVKQEKNIQFPVVPTIHRPERRNWRVSMMDLFKKTNQAHTNKIIRKKEELRKNAMVSTDLSILRLK